jgi:putative heme transporter
LPMGVTAMTTPEPRQPVPGQPVPGQPVPGQPVPERPVPQRKAAGPPTAEQPAAPPALSKVLPRSRLRETVSAARERIRAAREEANRRDHDADWDGDSGAGEHRDENQDVPYALRLTAAWGWRLLILAAVGYALLWVVGRLAAVVIPLVIALLLSALLAPAVRILRTNLRLPRSLATALVLVGGLLIVVGTLTLLVTQIVNGAPELAEKAGQGIGQIRDWLRDGPLHLSTQELDDTLKASGTWVRDNRQSLTSGAFATATAGL